jgi:hypothetical protein
MEAIVAVGCVPGAGLAGAACVCGHLVSDASRARTVLLYRDGVKPSAPGPGLRAPDMERKSV